MQRKSDLVQKWLLTGLLRDVKQEHMQHVAERLDAANRKHSPCCNTAIDEEIRKLTEQGYYGRTTKRRA